MLRTAVVLILVLATPALALEDVNATLDTTVDEALDVQAPGAAEVVGDAAKAFGDALGRAAGAVADAAAAAVRGLSSLGAAASMAAAGAVASVGDTTAVAVTGLGFGMTTGLAVAIGGTFHGIAAAVGFIGAAVGAAFTAVVGLISLLRPEAMPKPAFVAVASTGAAATAGVGAWGILQGLRRWGLLGAGIAGFSRIADEKVLDQPMRAQLFSLIKENPGIHASHLAREVGGGWGTVTHHLDKLQKANLVTTRRVNNQKCFFEQGGQVSRQDMQVASALKGDTAAQITSFVQAHPMSSQKDVAQALGISPALASFHVKKLANLGVLEKMRQGKSTLLTTSESLRRLAANGDVVVAPMVAVAS